jgi:hypothetical protein
MASTLEQRLSRSLRSILADLPNGESLPDSEQFREVLTGLEWFIPVVLAEIYREWNFQGLDGVVPVQARKTGEGEVEIFGLCILICDQTLAPLHLRLQVAASGAEVSWLECRLGERGEHGMVRTPYDALGAAAKRLHALQGRAEQIAWVYKVTFGDRRLG